MIIKLKAPRIYNGELYQKGTQEVPDSLMNIDYFKKGLECGIVEILVQPEVIAEEIVPKKTKGKKQGAE